MGVIIEPGDPQDTDDRISKVLAEGGTLARNEYGTVVSVHTCRTCGEPFTLCPPTVEASFGPDCLAATCPSYDPSRDAEIYFAPDDPELIEGSA